MLDEQGSPHSQARIFVHPPEELPYQVVAAYLGRCRQDVRSLKDGIDRLDFDFARTYGHRMKGSGGAYGFPQLTKIGASIEEAARGHNGDTLRNCAATLETYLESIEVAEV
jgi:HPt (histidine-containing phosphotransfer) domain-containing protein